jgi:hypothetical protein
MLRQHDDKKIEIPFTIKSRTNTTPTHLYKMNLVPYASRLPLLRPKRVEGENYEEALRAWQDELTRRLSLVPEQDFQSGNNSDNDTDEYYSDSGSDFTDDNWDVESTVEYEYEENPMTKAKYYTSTAASLEELNETVPNMCCVCLDTPKKMDSVTTNCNHTYCVDCYARCKKGTCPMCRQRVYSLTTYVLVEKNK